MNRIGCGRGIGGALRHALQGESFIRHIGNDKLIFDFKEGSGTTVHDKSHNNNDGTFGAGAAAPTWKRNSLYFDGGDYVDLTGIKHGISTGAFTLLFDIDSITAQTYFLNSQTNYWHLEINASYITRIYIAIGFLISDAINTISPLSLYITRDTAGNIECYVSGKIQSKGKSNAGDVTYDGTSAFKLGSSYGAALGLTGTMYSFRILNKGLSGIEAQQIYLSQKWRGNN